MPSVADRVKETSNTAGTGTLTLAGAVAGYQSFASAFATGTVVYYCIVDGNAWEVGYGAFTTSGTTLARTTILASSNSGAAINCSGAGEIVFCTMPADAKTNGSQTVNESISGDQLRISIDTSYLRLGSWSVTASGALYTLLGDYAMVYWTHNTALDANGNFLGADDNGSCQLWGFTEHGLEFQYTCPTTTAGQVPGTAFPWVQTRSFNFITGALTGAVQGVGYAMARGLALP
jgi:hypothetical protein